MTISGVDASAWLESTKQPHVTGRSVCVRVHVWVWRPKRNLWYYSWGTLHFYFFRPSLTMAWNSPSRLTSQWAPWIHLFAPLTSWIISMHSLCLIFKQILRTKSRSLCWHRKNSASWGICPALVIHILYLNCFASVGVYMCSCLCAYTRNGLSHVQVHVEVGVMLIITFNSFHLVFLSHVISLNRELLLGGGLTMGSRNPPISQWCLNRNGHHGPAGSGTIQLGDVALLE